MNQAAQALACCCSLRSRVEALEETPPGGPVPDDPATSITLAVQNGVAVTFMRSDAAPALDQSIGPTWTGKHTFSQPPRFPSYTVATLPAGALGDIAVVTDATAPTYLGVLVGGGAVVCPVFHNGVAWISH